MCKNVLFIISLFWGIGLNAQPVMPPVWDIVKEDFESGNLNDWENVPENVPFYQPFLVPGEGRNGSTALGVDVTSESYLYRYNVHPARQGYYTFWFNPNDVQLPEIGNWIPGESILLATVKDNIQWHSIIGVRLRQIDGGYYAYLEWRDPSGSQYDYVSGSVPLINGWQKITLVYYINNSIQLWIDDVLARQVTGIVHEHTDGKILEIGKCNSYQEGLALGTVLFDDILYQIPSVSDFWVNARTGDDLNDGLTPGSAFATIQKAADLAGPSTVVHVAGGVYREQIKPQYSGLPGQDIVYHAEPSLGDSVVIDGTGIDVSGWGGLFHMYRDSCIKISGFKFKYSGWAGVFAQESGYLTIEDNKTYDTRSSGILLHHCHHAYVRRNDIRRAVNGGTQECLSISHVNNFEICYNEVHDGVGLASGGEGLDVKNNSYSGRVHHNYIHDLPKDYDPDVHDDYEVGLYIDAYMSQRPDHLHDVQVYNNRIHHVGTGIAIGAEIYGDVENVTVFNNIVYDCWYSGIEITNWVNPSGGTKKNVYIINNTVVNCGHHVDNWPLGQGIFLGSKNPDDENFVVRNNILSRNFESQLRARAEVRDNLTAEYNLIDGFRGYDDEEIYGDFPVIGDPLFAAPAFCDFSLLPESPAIDAGTAGSAPDFDFENTPRPQDGNGDFLAEFDIGAFEYVYPGVPIGYSFPVEGWYLVSIPGLAKDMNVAILFPDAAGAFFYENTTYIQKDVLEPGVGFWLYFDTPSQAQFNIVPINDYTIHLDSPGWYLIGGVYDTLPVNQLYTIPAGKLVWPVCHFDTPHQQYVFTESIEPQQGYWILVSDECDLYVGGAAVSRTTSFSKINSVVPPQPPDLNTCVPVKQNPAVFQVSPAYPNPFNARTTIRYSVPAPGRVFITVYNLRGEKIRTLLQQSQLPGIFGVVWDGKSEYGIDVSSGIYFIHVQCGGQTRVSKILLVK
ncbi:right-handed parallel beta-helix repeat-containing protein [candidate division KSB1 bacterium]|nr:right-handed parallel beta-helix repeat-containing protein [candidate division KSB1 bacterium]